MYGNGKRPKGRERYTSLFYALQNQKIPQMLEGQYVGKNGHTVYSLYSKIELKRILATTSNPNEFDQTYALTERLLRIIYIATTLIGYDQTLYQPAYELLEFNLEELETHQDEIDLPDKEKEEFIAYADQVRQGFHQVIPVDYFYTEDGNFDAYEWMGLSKKQFTENFMIYRNSQSNKNDEPWTLEKPKG